MLYTEPTNNAGVIARKADDIAGYRSPKRDRITILQASSEHAGGTWDLEVLAYTPFWRTTLLLQPNLRVHLPACGGRSFPMTFDAALRVYRLSIDGETCNDDPSSTLSGRTLRVHSSSGGSASRVIVDRRDTVAIDTVVNVVHVIEPIDPPPCPDGLECSYDDYLFPDRPLKAHHLQVVAQSQHAQAQEPILQMHIPGCYGGQLTFDAATGTHRYETALLEGTCLSTLLERRMIVTSSYGGYASSGVARREEDTFIREEDWTVDVTGVCRDDNGDYPRWSAYNWMPVQCATACLGNSNCQGFAMSKTKNYCQLFGSDGRYSASKPGVQITQGHSSYPQYTCYLKR